MLLLVQEGWLGSDALYLDACPEAPAAKHIQLENDTFPGGLVEPLVPLTPHAFAPLAPGLVACAAGCVLARADGTTAGDRDALGEKSLLLRGTLDGAPVELTSTLLAAQEAALPDGLPTDTRLRVTRDPASLLDGVDPAREDPGLVGLEVLTHLAEDTRFDLE